MAIQKEDPGLDTLLYNPHSHSQKHQYYYNRISANSKHFFPHVTYQLSDVAGAIHTSRRINRSLSNSKFDELFYGSVGSIPFAEIAGRFPHATINSFDDGTFHTDPDHFWSFVNSEPLSHKLYKKAVRAPLNVELIARAHRHYTIYNPALNVMSGKEIVPLNAFSGIAGSAAWKGELKVLLGTPEPSLLGFSTEEYSKLIGDISYDIYVPHPRERRAMEVIPIIPERDRLLELGKDLIAEDLAQEISQMGYKISLAGFGSTALLNLCSIFPVTNYASRGHRSSLAFEKMAINTRFVR